MWGRTRPAECAPRVAPRTASAFASVAPLVKRTSSALLSRSRAMRARAPSRHSRAFRPSACGEDGLPETPAAISRYVRAFGNIFHMFWDEDNLVFGLLMMVVLAFLCLSMDAPLIEAKPGEDNCYRNRPAPRTEPVGGQVAEEVCRAEEKRGPNERADNHRRYEAPERQLQEPG